MERIHLGSSLFLASLAGWAVCCGSLSTGSALVRFREGASANVVIRFYSWDSIQIVRPDIREGGFLPLLNRESVIRKLDQTEFELGLAVIVLGNTYSKVQEANVIRDWESMLRERGFRRVVALRASLRDEIDGLLILYDSAISAGRVQREKIDTTSATVPPAAGTDATHSSGHSVR